MLSPAQPWPPDYVEEFATRQKRIRSIRADPVLRLGLAERYRNDPVAWINHWGVTYDPRVAGTDKPTTLPFVLFRRQIEFADFLLALVNDQQNGLVEKSRDMGATWLCCAFSVWLWLYWPGAAVGWGSRKEQLVDKIGDPDSIFEKMRIIIRHLPKFMLPAGFSEADHMPFMKIINPETGATITGEAGDNIGRGGRKLIYHKDEAQPLNAPILTPSGWSTMGAMRLGTRVIAADGKEAKVIGINEAGAHEIYRFRFSDGSTADCSPNHLWTVDKAWGKRERLTLRALEIAEKFEYRAPSGQTQYLYRVPLCEPVEFEDRGELPLHPYLVGALLGDGTIGGVPSHSPRITTADEDIIDQFRELLPVGCTITKEKDRITWRLGDERGRCGKNVKSRSREAVVAAGIAGLGAAEKHIPDAYKLASPEGRLALLQGLMDTDGSVNNGTVTFHTCSARLADDVQFVVQSLGGVASHNVKADRRGFLDQHVLHIRLPAHMTPFRLRRKLTRCDRKRAVCRTIVGVEKMPPQPVRCITIDRTDGLYLTSHCIVTHNSAHYERPEKIEAALADNTNCQIDISSVNGLGNVFHRRREAGEEWKPGKALVRNRANVFIMDWRDHPAKDQKWYDERRAKAEADGLLHVFAQEVDRDYSASVEGVIIPAAWVASAIDAHIRLGFDDTGGWSGALDVADEGGDLHALALRKGVILRHVEDWGEGDVGEATRKAVDMLDGTEIDLQYDSVGVGAGVKAEANRLEKEKKLPKGMHFVPWSAGAAPLNPDDHVIPDDKESPLNKDFYKNLKAQAWWELRRRFERTHKAVTEDEVHDPEDLISLPSDLPNLRKLQKELSQPTRAKTPGTLKMVVNKTPEGTRSPNMADAVVMAYWPLPRASTYRWDTW